jgi:hypothetical protein
MDSSLVKDVRNSSSSREEILFEIASVIARDVNATASHLYVVRDNDSIVRFEPGNERFLAAFIFSI